MYSTEPFSISGLLLSHRARRHTVSARFLYRSVEEQEEPHRRWAEGGELLPDSEGLLMHPGGGILSDRLQIREFA